MTSGNGRNRRGFPIRLRRRDGIIQIVEKKLKVTKEMGQIS
jgi:hypothetical protein